MKKAQRVLVTGATGYIGGSLAPHLLQAGYTVRVMVRDPDRLKGRWWAEKVEVAVGDALRPETLPLVLEDVDAAYYFLHSLYAGPGFHEMDLRAARDFSHAAQRAGVGHILYLGGLGNPADPLSTHLRSRQETGAALRGGVPVTEFRSAIVIGSGSGSFEMIRYLTERIPVMTSPRWVRSRIQPIAIDDVLAYLTAALEVPPEGVDRVIQIGGADVITFGDTLRVYARMRGLRRLVLILPVLTPGLSSHWVGWVTPISARIARPLIEGLHYDIVVRNDTARRLFPDIHPVDYRTAVRLALDDLHPARVDTAWLDAQAAADPERVVSVLQEGMYIYRVTRRVNAPPKAVYAAFCGLGGERGWPYANWAWRLRGTVDRLLGGPGLRKGRRPPDEIAVGDAVDFFRVEAVEPGRLLRLRLEARVPGRFWLQFEAQPADTVHPADEGRTRFVQTVFFDARGLAGLLYWNAFRWLRIRVFSGLAGEIARRANQDAHAPSGGA
jgi:uncharacterized protein YbjT (DUF2867 family)